MVFTKSSLCLMAVLLSLACAQLQNSVDLDPEGSFRLDWTVDSSADPNNPRIVFQTFVKTQGAHFLNIQNLKEINEILLNSFRMVFDPLVEWYQG